MADLSYIDNQLEEYNDKLTKYISGQLKEKLYMANDKYNLSENEITSIIEESIFSTVFTFVFPVYESPTMALAIKKVANTLIEAIITIIAISVFFIILPLHPLVEQFLMVHNKPKPLHLIPV